jgi:serine/threonine protein kinase
MTVVAVKQIYVEDDAKRRQMTHELSLLCSAFQHQARENPLLTPHGKAPPGKAAAAAVGGSVTRRGRAGGSDDEDGNIVGGHVDGDGGNVDGDGDEVDDDGARFVVALHDAYTDKEERSVCLVLEHMSGGALEDYVKAGVRLTEAQLAHVARCCCRALSGLKKRRLLHRDIKPSNILVDHR